MSTTTMHFGPEWMRTKHQAASRTQPPPSPPPAGVPATSASTYSSLVSAAPATQPDSRDEAHPFRYSKEEMLRIYKEGGGKGGLGLEVERWEGVVREVGTDPVGLREMDEAEKKLFASPLNSDLRRRQSNDYLHLNMQNVDRPRLNHANSGAGTGSPLRERYSGLMSRRRDSTELPPLTPRKLSLTGQTPLMSPRDTGLPSPRGRLAHSSGFDGVLNSGDSWVARRRASEGLTKVTAVSARELDEENNGLKIREEEEENNPEPDPKPDPQHDSNEVDSFSSSAIPANRSEIIETGMAQLSVEVPSNQIVSHPSPGGTSALGPPPGIVDLASVEWSYLDPQGQIQGPFRADLMQKWHDDGYFVPELLMKRTTFDTEWIPVGELARRAGGGKVFLTPLPPSIPPGLARRTDSPFSYSTDQNAFANGPYQPSPIRSLRSSTLDSYLGTGSNHSDSPASSFGAGRFGNGSPDPSAFGGRANQYAVGEIGGRLGGYSLAGGEASPALSGRGAPFGTPPVEYRSPGFGNVIQGRGGSLDTGYGMNGGFGSPVSPWPPTTTALDVLNAGRSIAEPISYQNSFNSLVTSNGSSLVETADTNGFHGSFGTPGEQTLATRNLGGIVYPDPSSSSPATHFTTTQQIPPAVTDILEQQAASRTPMTHQPAVTVGDNATSSWGAVESFANKRPGTFDRTHPTSSNTVATSQSSPWPHNGRMSRSTSQANEPSPWLLASQGVTDSWKEEPEHSKQPVNSLGHHDSQRLDVVQPAPNVAEEALPEAAPLVSAPDVQLEPTLATPAPKGRTKPVSQNAQPQSQSSAKSSVVPEIPPINSELQQAQVPPKAAWAKEDDSKKTAATSLRKIQDAEAKKAEARRAAEREKERAARAAALPTTATEDIQPFTASWGLPTSQAGKSAGSAPPKDSAASPTQPTVAPAPAVWTSAAKPPVTKKTMKEIQEEEERRKKTAVKESVANVAARRGYAESTTKAPPPSQGNAWTTVGPSGKLVPGAGAPSRPSATPSASTGSSSSIARTNGAPPAARPAPTPVAKAPSNGPKVDDFPVAPSHEFLKWLNDSLKGLNNSVNVEEIMSMLLSFPLDPDPSTTEIISEMIYANSTTLDGRRFASDFITRRKADAVTRSKNGSGAGSGKPISIADVVKAQPKPQSSSEWGGFKVVNKKKKGGRS